MSDNEIKRNDNQYLSKDNILNKNIENVIEEFLNKFNSKQTKRRYNKVLINFSDFIEIENLEDLGNFHFSDLSAICLDFIDTYKNYDKENKERINNPTTVNNIGYILRSFFNHIIFNYNYPKNPMGMYKPLSTKENSNTDSLNRKEIIDILKHYKEKYLNKNNEYVNLRNYLIFCFLSLSLRRQEIVNLRWSDLNKEKQFINIEQKGRSYKEIPLPAGIYDYLLIFKKIKEEKGLDSNYLFNPTKNNTNKTSNKPISTHYIYKLIKKTCDELNIDKNITPHSFRKSFIELSLDKNENYNNIMNATGHKTSQMIRYYDNRDKLKNNSINQLSDLF